MKLYLRTFGCRANQYDTEMVRALASAAGCEIVTSPDEADAAVINSCAVTAAAERDMRHAVRAMAARRPSLRTVVMGCAAAITPPRGAAGSLHGLPTVSAVIPAGDVRAVVAALSFESAGSAATPTPVASLVAADPVGPTPALTPSSAVFTPPLPTPSLPTPHAQSGTRALLRVQDGCDEHCTFCATTLARGAHRSRDEDELVSEAARLAEHHAEIVITGIHIGSWGKERGATLGALVRRLVDEVPHVRFRLTSIEATELDDALVELFRSVPLRVAPHLHAPLQSGSDTVLRRMGRHWYTARSYAEAIERLVDGLEHFAVGADVIAGFPGETDDDHAATMALVERLPFTSLHVFPWSERPGTAAVRLRDRVPAGVARQRAAELRALGEAKAGLYAARRAGGTADIVVIGDGAARSGLTGDYLTVSLADPAPPRGARFRARLESGERRLIAHPIHSAAP